MERGNAEDVGFVASDECGELVYDLGRIECFRERFHLFWNILSLWIETTHHCI